MLEIDRKRYPVGDRQLADSYTNAPITRSDMEALVAANRALAQAGLTRRREADLAESLAATVADLDAYIERRAGEIAQPRIAAAAQSAERRIAELQQDLAAGERRREDVIAEFERQRRAQDRQIDQQAERIADLKATVGRVRAVRCWENEDHKWFAFREDLFAALDGEVDPS